MSLLFTFVFVGVLASAKDTTPMTLSCPSNQYLVRSHYRSGYVRSDGSVVRPATVNAYCRDKSSATLFLEGRLRNSLPTNWPHSKEKGKSWTDGERERVLEEIERLPDKLLNKNIVGIYRASKSVDYPNPASSAAGIIVIYDSAFDKNRNLGQIITHEIAHQEYLDIGRDVRNNYQTALDWEVDIKHNGAVKWIGRKEGYVEEDGRISPAEDYSNNIDHYLYKPDKLKKMTPKAYEWFKTHYGKDFLLKGASK